MLNFIIRRICHCVIVLFVISFLAFITTYLAKGDVVEMYYIAQNQSLPQEEILHQKRLNAGIYNPLIVRYFTWLKNFISGDMGMSFEDGLPVSQKISAALPNTLKLAFSSFIFSFSVAIFLSVFLASKKGSLVDKICTFLAFVLASIPNFVLGVILLIVFSVHFGIFPVISRGSNLGLVLPTIALSLPIIGKYTRQIRAKILDEKDKGYVCAFKCMGIKNSIIMYQNVLKASLPFIFTIQGIALGGLMGGVVIIENLFVYPGLGIVMMQAISFRDFPVIQAFVLLSAFAYLIINLIVDILHKFIDPRINLG